MKRSEFEAKQLRHHQTKRIGAPYNPRGETSYADCVRFDAEAAEAAGVVWDPEEGPLCQRLVVDAHGTWVAVHAEVSGVALCSSRLLTPAEAAEAVRRYNAWPELEKLAHLMGPGFGLCSGCEIFYGKLMKILSGGSPA